MKLTQDKIELLEAILGGEVFLWRSSRCTVLSLRAKNCDTNGEFKEVEYESMLLWMEGRRHHFYVQEWEVQ